MITSTIPQRLVRAGAMFPATHRNKNKSFETLQSQVRPASLRSRSLSIQSLVRLPDRQRSPMPLNTVSGTRVKVQ